jgi:hypothetical protein
VLAALAVGGCGEKAEPPVQATPGPTGATGATGSPAAAPARPLQLGVSEANPGLIAPGAAPTGFGSFRDALTALRPDYYRLVVDWAKFQPDAAAPADLAAAQDGCGREAGPCAAYAGVRADLEAVRAARAAAGGGWEVVVVLYGVPDWAAAPAGGCRASTPAARSGRGGRPRSRPITAAGLAAYGRLIGRLRALGAEVGVPLRWWSPWNEPNHPSFVSPQRAACSASSPTLSPAVYGRLVGAARAALRGSGARLVLGELAGFRGPRPQGAGVGEFIRALPDAVACRASAWSQHEYASPQDEPAAPFSRDAVAEAEAALAERPCTRAVPVWVTETGVGGARSGTTRATDAPALGAQCAAQAARLERWNADPRVQAAFQYSFREDTAYPVGLADARLTTLYPTYALWRAWADARGPASPPRPAGCGAAGASGAIGASGASGASGATGAAGASGAESG